MYQKQSLILLAVLPFLGNIEACSVRNASCNDLKTKDGYYRYVVNATDPTAQIQVSLNGTNIGYSEPGLEPRFSKEVVKMDNHSVTTFHCTNLQIMLIFNRKGHRTSEICERFNIIEKQTTPEAPNSSTAWKTIFAVVVFAVILCAALGYVLWKKKRGDAGSPGVIGAVVPQGVNGNVWHAPDDGTEEHSNGNKLDGGTLGEQGPEGLESNGAVLPCSERAARRRVDETGETEALVNMLGSSTECTPPRDIL